jgi:hypothetical protein
LLDVVKELFCGCEAKGQRVSYKYIIKNQEYQIYLYL